MTLHGYIFGAGLPGLTEFSIPSFKENPWPRCTCPPRNLIHPSIKVFVDPISPMTPTESGELGCQREREMLDQ